MLRRTDEPDAAAQGVSFPNRLAKVQRGEGAKMVKRYHQIPDEFVSLFRFDTFSYHHWEEAQSNIGGPSPLKGRESFAPIADETAAVIN